MSKAPLISCVHTNPGQPPHPPPPISPPGYMTPTAVLTKQLTIRMDFFTLADVHPTGMLYLIALSKADASLNT